MTKKHYDSIKKENIKIENQCVTKFRLIQHKSSKGYLIITKVILVKKVIKF